MSGESALPSVSIDLGTTNSVLACMDNDGRPVTITNAGGNPLTYSTLLTDEQGTVVGRSSSLVSSVPWMIGILLAGSLASGFASEVIAAETNPFVQLLVLAEEGDGRAQALVARTFRLGVGTVLHDPEQCLDWAAKSAASDDPLGKFELAIAYQEGVGIKADPKQAQQAFKAALPGVRKLAREGLPVAESMLGAANRHGWGTEKDVKSAVEWFQKAAKADDPHAQFALAMMFRKGEGVAQNAETAFKLFEQAAEHHYARAEVELGRCYKVGVGVETNAAWAFKWFRRAASQGDVDGQYELAVAFRDGLGTQPLDRLAYRWATLAAKQGHAPAVALREDLAGLMSLASQIDGHQWAKTFRRVKRMTDHDSTGTGFFVTADGYLVTNRHVIKGAKRILVRIGTKQVLARVVKSYEKHDLAVLKVPGQHRPLSLRKSSTVTVGTVVMAMGFPQIKHQGIQPKLTGGVVSSLSGSIGLWSTNRASLFQMDVAAQPGNSGGPLIDTQGNVIGVVTYRLPEFEFSEKWKVESQNVNYAIKASFLISRLEQLSEIRSKLLKPHPVMPAKPRLRSEVIRDLEAATVLVLVEKDRVILAKEEPAREYWVGRYGAFRGKQVVEIRRDGDFIVAVKVTGDWQFGGKGVISWRGNLKTRQIEGQMRQNAFAPLMWVPGRIDNLDDEKIEISGRVGLFRRRIKYRRPKPGEVEELVRKDR